MSGTILENLSGRKLSILVSILMLCQVACFLIGGLNAPLPDGDQTVGGGKCRDVPGRQNDTSFFLYSRGYGFACNSLPDIEIEQDELKLGNQWVYVFQLPLSSDYRRLDYSRWQQNVIGVLQVDIAHNTSTELWVQPKDLPPIELQLTIDIRLAYRNQHNADKDWKLYAYSVEQRYLDCRAVYIGPPNTRYTCDAVSLFELGALHYNFYVFNVRFPIDTPKQRNLQFGHVHDLTLTIIHQDGCFIVAWLQLKTLLFPFVIGIMIWFWRRVHILQRSPALLEYMLLYLGGALSFLNLPLEYLTRALEMQYMLLLNGLRQGIFYAMLLSFWLVFAGEHMLIQDSPNKSTIRSRYWKHLSAVVVGCISVFVFAICERGVQLRNPFYSIWTSPLGDKVAMSFIVLVGVSAAIYFLCLCFMMLKVFKDIGDKGTSLPQARHLQYEGLIYRFKFLILATLLCAGLTVADFIMGQMTVGHWKWNEDIETQLTSAFLTGVYGMWNIYIFALIILYAPSHKQWPTMCHNDETVQTGDCFTTVKQQKLFVY